MTKSYLQPLQIKSSFLHSLNLGCPVICFDQQNVAEMMVYKLQTQSPQNSAASTVTLLECYCHVKKHRIFPLRIKKLHRERSPADSHHQLQTCDGGHVLLNLLTSYLQPHRRPQTSWEKVNDSNEQLTQAFSSWVISNPHFQLNEKEPNQVVIW